MYTLKKLIYYDNCYVDIWNKHDKISKVIQWFFSMNFFRFFLLSSVVCCFNTFAEATTEIQSNVIVDDANNVIGKKSDNKKSDDNFSDLNTESDSNTSHITAYNNSGNYSFLIGIGASCFGNKRGVATIKDASKTNKKAEEHKKSTKNKTHFGVSCIAIGLFDAFSIVKIGAGVAVGKLFGKISLKTPYIKDKCNEECEFRNTLFLRMPVLAGTEIGKFGIYGMYVLTYNRDRIKCNYLEDGKCNLDDSVKTSQNRITHGIGMFTTYQICAILYAGLSVGYTFGRRTRCVEHNHKDGTTTKLEKAKISGKNGVIVDFMLLFKC